MTQWLRLVSVKDRTEEGKRRRRRKELTRCEEESLPLLEANLKPAMWCCALSGSTWFSSWWFWIIHTSYYKGNQASSLFLLLSLTVMSFCHFLFLPLLVHTHKEKQSGEQIPCLVLAPYSVPNSREKVWNLIQLFSRSNSVEILENICVNRIHSFI